MWIIITKDTASSKFYPIDVISQVLPNSMRMNYRTAKSKPISFWVDKKVIFHMTWAGKYLKVWQTFYRPIARNARQFWIEFDANHHINRLQNIDKSFRRHLCMYYRIYKYCNKFLWELPMSFNPFMGKSIRVSAGIYQRTRELPVGRNKDIDFLGFIDQRGYNAANTLRLLAYLSNHSYKVKCVMIDSDTYQYYNRRKRWEFEIIKNSKTEPGQRLFHSLLDRSKVLIDLSYRLTLGRNLYEALFHGALCICPTTYGASELLFPDLIIDPLLIDLIKVREKCIETQRKWSPAEVQSYRNRANKVAGVQRTVRRLQSVK